MRVLVTGTDGYVGSLLRPVLLGRGHEVVGVDTGFYADAQLYDATVEGPTIREDIRRLRREHLTEIDAVVHLAELSNDPLGQLRPEVTYAVNHLGSVHVASLAKDAGVERFVYASSCSVYGIADASTVDEDSPTDPRSTYAACKVLVERDLRKLADESFSPTSLRFGTAYGASPRMRFDVVLNNLCGLAWTTSEITLDSDGTPWRPLIHALDMCEAIACTLEAARERVHCETLNVGAPGANYRIRDIAEIVADVFEGCTISIGTTSPDIRSYRVSFDKIREVLPRFNCEWEPHRGARQLLGVFRRINLTREDFESRAFTRLKQIEHLLETEVIDRSSFFWTVEPPRAAPPV
jgi:nucleoside-diphosphate-sugar epimerase